jgi:glycerol uptake facilitator-like aquaporin
MPPASALHTVAELVWLRWDVIRVHRKFLCETRLAADGRLKKQNAAPLTIGLAVTAGVFAEGPFTGGSMNPARTIGAAIAFMKFAHILIYIIATVCGACAAGICYDKIYLEDVQPAELEDRDEGEYDGA